MSFVSNILDTMLNFRKILFIPTRTQWEKWSLPSKATLVALWFGVITYSISSAPQLYNWVHPPQVEEIVDRDMAEAMLSGLHELDANLIILDSMSAIYNERRTEKSPGVLNYDNALNFFHRYFDLVFPMTYGESENLIPFLSSMEKHSIDLNLIKNKADIVKFNSTHHFSVDDIRLLTGFYIYYLSVIIDKHLPESFSYTTDLSDEIYLEEKDQVIMNEFMLWGEPVKDYSTVLDLLD